MPWLEPAHEQEVDEQIQIGGDGFAIHPERACELGSVEEAGLVMGEHGPETPQGLCRNARTKHGYVALQICTDEVLPPALACPVRGSKETVGKAAAYP